MFDSIVAQANEQLGLDKKAEILLSALLALMTDAGRGGLAGFTGRFNRAGFGDAASSWISSGVNAEVSNEQLETALGIDTLGEISKRIGTDYNVCVAAAAFMIPRLVSALTPDGVVPPDGDLLIKIGGFLTNAPGTTTTGNFERVGAAGAPVLDAEKKNVVDANAVDRVVSPTDDKVSDSSTDTAIGDKEKNNSPLAWLLPLILLGLLLTLGYWFCSKSSPVATMINSNLN